jgi:hypothetical protein
MPHRLLPVTRALFLEHLDTGVVFVAIEDEMWDDRGISHLDSAALQLAERLNTRGRFCVVAVITHSPPGRWSGLIGPEVLTLNRDSDSSAMLTRLATRATVLQSHARDLAEELLRCPTPDSDQVEQLAQFAHLLKPDEQARIIAQCQSQGSMASIDAICYFIGQSRNRDHLCHIQAHATNPRAGTDSVKASALRHLWASQNAELEDSFMHGPPDIVCARIAQVVDLFNAADRILT